MAEKRLNIKVTTEGTDKAAQQANSLSSNYKKVASTIAAITAAYLAATKAAKFFSDSVKRAGEQEAIFKKLETSINLTGKSYDNITGNIDRTLKSLQALTEYGDTDSAQALTQMVQLTGDFDQAMKYLPLTLDLAATGLFNLDTAARYMAMALAGNVEMLGRYIPELRTANNENLKTMTQAEKTAYAMQLLNDKFGGSAQANLDNYASKVKQLNNYWGDIKEAIGNNLLPLLTTVTEQILKLTDAAGLTSKEYDKFLAEFTKTANTSSIDQLTGSIQYWQEELKASQDSYAELVGEIENGTEKSSRRFQAMADNTLKYIESTRDKLSILINELTTRKISFPINIELDIPDLEEIDTNEVIKYLDKIPELTGASLDKMTELQNQYYQANTDNLQQQQDTESAMWLDFYNNLIIDDEEYERMKTAIREKYADMRDKIATREAIRETQAVGQLVGALGNLAEAMGANAATLKVLKSGEAIINTYAGAARALADYPAPASFLVAAATIANGLASVAKINAVGFQFGTEGYTVPAGNPNDSYMFAAKSGENIQVTPAGKESNSGNKELIAEIRNLGNRLDKIQKYEIRTIDDIQISELAESGNFARSRI